MMRVTASLTPTLLVALFTSFVATALRADDWPQWLGAKRDGIWRESGLVETLPKEGLPIRWRAPVAAGYAGPAVTNGRVFVTDRIVEPTASKPGSPFDRVKLPGKERVLCFNEADGEPLWTHEYDCPYTISYAAGPRTTPTVDGERVYTLGAEGHLFCFEAATGKVIWSKVLSSEDHPAPMWGFAAHPLVDGDKLIVITADPKGVVMAMNKETGEELWKALSAKDPGYAPPMIYEAGGKRQLIVWHTESVNSLDPETGKVYWTQPFGPANFGVTIITPQLYRDPKLGDLLFVSTQYEGSLMMRLDPKAPKASVLWQSEGRDDGLHILVPTPVLRDGHLYGVDNKGPLRCLRIDTGERVWATTAPTSYQEERISWTCAFLTPLGETGNRYLIANEHGDLILANLTPDGYRELSRTHLLDPTNTDAQRPVLWVHPAYANRSIYWRNDKELVCASMAATETK